MTSEFDIHVGRVIDLDARITALESVETLTAFVEETGGRSWVRIFTGFEAGYLTEQINTYLGMLHEAGAGDVVVHPVAISSADVENTCVVTVVYRHETEVV